MSTWKPDLRAFGATGQNQGRTAVNTNISFLQLNFSLCPASCILYSDATPCSWHFDGVHVLNLLVQEHLHIQISLYILFSSLFFNFPQVFGVYPFLLFMSSRFLFHTFPLILPHIMYWPPSWCSSLFHLTPPPPHTNSLLTLLSPSSLT